jgi:hypothetical protein
VLLRRVPSSSSPSKGLYNPRAFITHAASLDQGCPHCPRFPTAASRRSLGRVSVPVWLIVLSDQLPITALVGRYPTNQLIGRGPLPSRQSFGHSCEWHHPVLAAVSRGCPRAQGRSPRVTHPSATGCRPEEPHPVRLACVRRAASVRSEPGSNSQLGPPPLRRAPGPTASLHKASPPDRPPAISRSRPRRPTRASSKATGSNPAPAPGRPKGPPDPKPRGLRPATSSGCLSPTTPKPPPTHPFLPYLTLSKEHTGARGYAQPRCSAGKPRLIVTKPPANKPFFASILNINPTN